MLPLWQGLWRRFGKECASSDGSKERISRPSIDSQKESLIGSPVLRGPGSSQGGSDRDHRERTSTCGQERHQRYPHRDDELSDPVGEGLVASLARPGGNVTGFSASSYELSTKRLEILKDTVPNLTRVGALQQGGGARADLALKELMAAGSRSEAKTTGDCVRN